MTPSAQALFLELVISNDFKRSQDKLAKILGVTKMSVSRAFKELKEFNLITESLNKGNVILEYSDSLKRIWKQASKYFVDPKSKILYVKRDTINDILWSKLVVSGEDALSEYSMLGEPKYKVYGITSKEWNILIEKPEILPSKDSGVCIIELWKHTLPKLNGYVHPLALVVSMASEMDERIKGELEDILENYKWKDKFKQ